MTHSDALGWFASALMLSARVWTDPRRALALALASNLSFVAYASCTGVHFVLASHLCLLALNGLRLWRTWGEDRPRALAPVRTAFAAVVLAALAGCGGGGYDEDAPATRPGTLPVDCVGEPSRCQ